ncbi:MAG: hypothetical protein ACOCUI_04295 [bacterium]
MKLTRKIQRNWGVFFSGVVVVLLMVVFRPTNILLGKFKNLVRGMIPGFQEQGQ